jgi:uncharacterized protein YhaN
MGIRIERVTARDIGPIKKFDQEFSTFNLVYSKNECGKTFLTEFIIRSLFRNIKRWQFRACGSGKVFLSGLDDDLVSFSPGSGKKLEDFWQESQKGIPMSMAKLLVSKGAQPAIDESSRGLGRALIKEVFSGASLLDIIDSDSNISKTIKGSQLDNGHIIINNTGEGRHFRQSLEDLKAIESIFEKLESEYDFGILQSYKFQLEVLEERLEKLHKAKCYKAYLLSQKIDELNDKLSENNEEALNEISRKISIYEGKKEDYNKKRQELEIFNKKCGDVDWLTNALALYEKLSLNNSKKPKHFLAIIASLLLIPVIIFAFSNNPIVVTVLIIAVSAIVLFYILGLVSSVKSAGPALEVQGIKNEFQERTGNRLNSMADLKAALEEQKGFSNKVTVLKEQLAENDKEISALSRQINDEIYDVTGSRPDESIWDEFIRGKKLSNREILKEIDSLRSKLIELGVRENEYLCEEIEEVFSFKEYDKTGQMIQELKEKVQQKESSLVSLKNSICRETGDDSSLDWERLIENLKRKREEKEKEHLNVKTKIIAGILVHNLVSELKAEEDEKIREGLDSDVVLEPLKTLTNYKRLYLDGEELIISDDTSDFYLHELSTGAVEQTMLALRIGLSSKILKKESAFLILDDAFQHSDWQRRKALVSQLADIALRGWQVIYFTMDDHIKGVVRNRRVKIGNDTFRLLKI